LRLVAAPRAATTQCIAPLSLKFVAVNSGIFRTTMTVVSILYKTYVTDLELRQAKFCITVLYGVTFAKSRERMLR